MRFILILFITTTLISCKTDQNNDTKSTAEEILESGQNNITTNNGIDSTLIKKYGPGSQIPSDKFTDVNDVEYSVNNWKGKYMLIDFWATWCGPCIDEQPHIKEMREKFKNIEFVSISIDDDKAFWKQFLEEKNLEVNEFWLANERNRPLHSMTYSIEQIDGQSMALMSLPTFTLIDPNGKILDRNFTRPSSDEFENDLKEALKKS